MKTDKNTYGLLLQTVNQYGSQHLVASLIRRKNDARYPVNCSDGLFSEDRPVFMQKFQLDGLQMKGFISTATDKAFVGWEPAYYAVHAIHLSDAKRMVTTLRAIKTRIAKDAAYNDAVECFRSLCTVLKLDFMVECTSQHKASSYADNTWHWMTVAEGRNRYRQMIAEMLKQAEAA
jgi:hypothetical protein